MDRLDDDFLNHLKCILEKYLGTITQLQEKLDECENLRMELISVKTKLSDTCEEYEARISELTAEIENLKMNKISKKSDHDDKNLQVDFAKVASAGTSVTSSKRVSFSLVPTTSTYQMVLSGNFGVENYYPDTSCDRYPNSTYLTFKSQAELFHELDKIEKRSLSSPCSNPFPNHHFVLEISEQYMGDRACRYETLKQFLNRFGTHVHFFSLCCEIDCRPTLWYLRAQEYLKVMPNLKMLQLKISSPSDNLYWSQRALNDLKSTCETLQTSPVLECLVAIDFENIPYQIMEDTLKRNKETVKMLQVTRTIAAMGNWLDFGLIRLENLTEFSITCFQMEEVYQLKLVNWPLKTLTIRLQFDLRLFGNELYKIFNVLEHFADTLMSLKITYFQTPICNSRLNLSKLQDLEVYFRQDASLDFILNLQSLEKLKVYLQNEKKDDLDDIGLHKYIHSLKGSVIWRLPNLKHVEANTCFNGVVKTYYVENSNLCSA